LATPEGPGLHNHGIENLGAPLGVTLRGFGIVCLRYLLAMEIMGTLSAEYRRPRESRIGDT